MPVITPDIQDSPAFDAQAVPDNSDVWAAIGPAVGTGVVSGMAVTQDTGADMKVAVSAGSCGIGGVEYPYAGSGGTPLTVSAASATDRKDVVICRASLISYTASATNGTTTLTLPSVAGLFIGSNVTGAGITFASIQSFAGNVVTIGGVITTLTASSYSFQTSTVMVLAGTPCTVAGWTRLSTALPPVKPNPVLTTDVLLAEVYVASTTTAITTASNIIDKTAILGGGRPYPMVLTAPIDTTKTPLAIYDTSPGRSGSANLFEIFDRLGAPIFAINSIGGPACFGDHVRAAQGVFGPFVSLDGTTNPASIQFPSNIRFWSASGYPTLAATSAIFSVGDLYYDSLTGISHCCVTAGTGAASAWERHGGNSVVIQNAPGATPSINVDTTDIATLTGLAVAVTGITITGHPRDGQKLIVRLTDNGTARALAWNATYFEASGTVALPTTTVLSVMLSVGFIYNGVTSKFRCVAVV